MLLFVLEAELLFSNEKFEIPPHQLIYSAGIFNFAFRVYIHIQSVTTPDSKNIEI